MKILLTADANDMSMAKEHQVESLEDLHALVAKVSDECGEPIVLIPFIEFVHEPNSFRWDVENKELVGPKGFVLMALADVHKEMEL